MARIVNVASAGQQAIQQAIDFADVMRARSYSGTRVYRQSKLAQIMSPIDLAEEVRRLGVAPLSRELAGLDAPSPMYSR